MIAREPARLVDVRRPRREPTSRRAKRVNQLYVIGGDGTHRGAYKLAELCWEKGVDVSVAGVPKTIDNDIGADSACKLTLTPSTRVASVRRGRAWFLFRF